MKFPAPRAWVIGGIARVVLKGRIWPFRQIRRFIDSEAPEVGKKMDEIADAPAVLIAWLMKEAGAKD